MNLLWIIQEHHLPEKIKAWSDKLQQPTDLQCSNQNELNNINRQITKARCTVEHHCHKLHCRQVQWCLQITAAINRILFWKSMLKWEKGRKVGLSILFAWAKKAKVDYVPYLGELTLEVIMHAILKAYKSF